MKSVESEELFRKSCSGCVDEARGVMRPACHDCGRIIFNRRDKYRRLTVGGGGGVTQKQQQKGRMKMNRKLNGLDETPNLIPAKYVPGLYYHTCNEGVIAECRDQWVYCPRCGGRLVWPSPSTPLNLDDYIEEVTG